MKSVSIWHLPKCNEMNKKDLENLVEIRVTEAASLLNSKHFPGAYYLAGYALESL
jgi:hypothetical protein